MGTDHLESGQRSVHFLASLPQFAVVDAPPGWTDAVWMNLNTPEDLKHQ